LLDFAGAMLHRFGMSEGPGTASHASAARPVGVLLSVNVGLPKDVSWQGKTVFTGVFKDPVSGPRRVRKLNLDGDGQGVLAGHGGEQRAVFVYQIDSYRYWERELERSDFVPGQFGENFTVDGLPDDQVCIGDRYRICGTEFEVTQPRVTCYRVGLRVGEPELPALLVGHHRPGFYMRVLGEGLVQAGDAIIKTRTGPGALSVADTDALLYLPHRDGSKLRRALKIPALSPGWQQSFRELLEAGTPDAVAEQFILASLRIQPFSFRRRILLEALVEHRSLPRGVELPQGGGKGRALVLGND
jgi:MOSC domain-containing protein YiiM